LGLTLHEAGEGLHFVGVCLFVLFGVVRAEIVDGVSRVFFCWRVTDTGVKLVFFCVVSPSFR